MREFTHLITFVRPKNDNFNSQIVKKKQIYRYYVHPTFLQISLVHIHTPLLGLSLESQIVGELALVSLLALALLEEQTQDTLWVRTGRHFLQGLGRSQQRVHLHLLAPLILLLLLWLADGIAVHLLYKICLVLCCVEDLNPYQLSCPGSSAGRALA